MHLINEVDLVFISNLALVYLSRKEYLLEMGFYSAILLNWGNLGVWGSLSFSELEV